VEGADRDDLPTSAVYGYCTLPVPSTTPKSVSVNTCTVMDSFIAHTVTAKVTVS
jgi:hypothetical protein